MENDLESGGRILSSTEHYGRCPVGLLLDPDVSDQECRAYAYLTTWDFARTGKMFGGREAMRAALGWSQAKLGRVLHDLEDHGAIRRIRRGLGLCNDIELLADVRSIDSEHTESSSVSEAIDPQMSTPSKREQQERTQEDDSVVVALPATGESAKTRRPREELAAIKSTADAVTRAWWDASNPKPTPPGGFAGVRRQIESFLRAPGDPPWSAAELLVALPCWTSFTNGQLEGELRRRRRARQLREEHEQLGEPVTREHLAPTDPTGLSNRPWAPRAAAESAR